jgi:hypothetical protein
VWKRAEKAAKKVAYLSRTRRFIIFLVEIVTRVLFAAFFIHNALFFVNVKQVPLTHANLRVKLCKDGLTSYL